MSDAAEVPAQPVELERPKRTRRFKKRVRFQPPKPIVPVKALWESASDEERARAHRTCALMIEYWLGQKTKAEMVSLLGLPPLRVWQLSQSALSGMLAGLLKQPRARMKGADGVASKTSELAELRKENARLKKELERSKIVLELLKDLPLNRAAASATSEPSGANPTGEKRRRTKARSSVPVDPGATPA
jgi:hypothetical protein